MPSVETQTTLEYTVIDNPNDTEVFNQIKMVKDTFVFYKGNYSTEQGTMTSYNSKVWGFMDSYIHQLIDSGD
jgi:hypothetical protein